MTQATLSSSDGKAPLREVYVSEQVIRSCFRHAFATEKEEVMGMLLGRLETRRFPSNNTNLSHHHNLNSNNGSNFLTSTTANGVTAGEPDASGDAASVCIPLPSSPSAVSPPPQPGYVEGKVAFIWSTHVSERSVQCSDRVEMSPESLVSAAETAEQVSRATGVTTTVLGWYHSHPKIPVVPSAVDLGTQKEHQQHFESGWVGLIVSVFNTEASLNRGHCALHCFQAGPCNEHLQVPFHVVPETTLFASVEPLQTLLDTTPDLLRVLQREIHNGVRTVEERTRHNDAATRAAQGLADAQLYEVEGLIAAPTLRELQLCSLPFLRAEVARLEKELASLPASVHISE
ncbi:metallo-peptidase Clan MP Family M67 [Lotmaria passim]